MISPLESHQNTPLPTCLRVFETCACTRGGVSHAQSETIAKYELEIKHRNDDIEKKTRDIDILNRKYVL